MSFVLLKSTTADRQEIGDIIVNTAFIEAVCVREIVRKEVTRFVIKVHTTDGGYAAHFNTLEEAREMIALLTADSAASKEVLPQVEDEDDKNKRAALNALKTLIS